MRVATSGDEDELVDLVTDADAILTCFAHVTERVIAAGHRLKVIARYGIGVDNIAVAAATQRGIKVTNVPDYCLDEVAEHVLALLLALARDIRYYDTAVRSDNWGVRDDRRVHRVAGRVLGVVGFGRVGRRVAERARGFGLRVIVADPTADQRAIRAVGAQPVEWHGLLAESDFVSLHTPLTPATRHLVGELELKAMKPTAFLINASRGGVIDHDALVRALELKWIAGAGLDVFEPEKLAPDHPLLGFGNVVATPHVAFYSEESLVELAHRAASSVVAVLHGHRTESVINAAALSAAQGPP